MTLEEFIDKYLGKKVDFDGAYGAQCVDLFRQYTKEVLGVPVHTGVVDGAKDLFLKHPDMPVQNQWLHRVKRAAAKPGDILVWDATPKNKYGHVAICVSRHGRHVCVIEQNGFTQTGVTFGWRSLAEGYLGALRRR